MYTPSSDGRRCLFTTWTTPVGNGLRVYVESKAFTEFYPITQQQAIETLGEGGYRVMTAADAKEFVGKLDELLPTSEENET